MFDLFYLRHRWKAFVRGSQFGSYIFMAALLSLIVLLIDTGINLSWGMMVEQVETQLGIPNGPSFILIILVLSDLIVKIILPKPIPKVHYYHSTKVDRVGLKVSYLVQSTFSLFNLLYLAIQVPIAYLCLTSIEGNTISVAGLGMIWFANTWLSIYLLAKSNNKVTYSLIGLLLVIQLLLGNYSGYLSFSPNWLVVDGLITVYLAIAAYLSYSCLEEFFKADQKTSKEYYSILNMFNNPLMQLEVALIMRNKRAKGTAIMGLVMIPYFFLIGWRSMENEIFQMVVSLMVSGLFIFQMGTYIFAWEGSFFDLLMTRSSPTEFIKHKYLFFTITGMFFSTVLAICFFIVYPTAFLLPVGCFLYNIGWNVPLIINNGFKNTEKIDMSKGIFMNYQGFNGTVILTSLVGLGIPLILFGIANVLFGVTEGALILAGIGIIGIALRNTFINKLSKKLDQKKYYLSACYRS